MLGAMYFMFMIPLNFHNEIKVGDYPHISDEKIKPQRQIKLFARGHIAKKWESLNF